MTKTFTDKDGNTIKLEDKMDFYNRFRMAFGKEFTSVKADETGVSWLFCCAYAFAQPVPQETFDDYTDKHFDTKSLLTLAQTINELIKDLSSNKDQTDKIKNS